MATRPDVIVDFEPSPRIAIVDSPSVEFVVQDIVDTLRKREDTFRGMSETKLINASGKEDLGGGNAVGITAELQDTQIAFEGRTEPAETGTVTTASSAPIGNSPARKDGLIELIDSNATFITNNVQRGSLVINFTDFSVAEVYSVISENTLITRLPSNGTTNTHQIGDAYHVFNIIQCELIGGNLVGADEFGNTQTPISPTAFTQIVRVAASSATITIPVAPPTSEENAAAVWEYSAASVISDSMGEIQRRVAFQQHIHVDVNNGVDGTAYPLGTHGHPVKLISDAVLIGLTEGISNINVAEDVTILATDNVNGFTIIGAHASKSEIIIQAGAQTQLSQFINCTLKGTGGGRIIVRESVIDDLANFEGIMFQTAIGGTVTLSATNNAISYFLDCFSGVPGQGTPTIDFDDTGHSIAVRNYNGGIKLVNKTDVQAISLDINTGQVILDGTVTAGDIVVRGIYHIEDNSGGTATVIRNTNLDEIEIKIDNVQVDVDVIQVTVGNMSLVIDDLIKYQRNRSVIDPLAYTLTIYQDDGVTALTTFDLKDSAGVASVTSIFERIPRLGSP